MTKTANHIFIKKAEPSDKVPESDVEAGRPFELVARASALYKGRHWNPN